MFGRKRLNYVILLDYAPLRMLLIMSHPTLSASTFSSLAEATLRNSPGLSFTLLASFRALFGVNPLVRCIVWNAISSSLTSRVKPAYLLWALMFLKDYVSEHANRLITGGLDEITFRKWSRDDNRVFFLFFYFCFQISWASQMGGDPVVFCKAPVDCKDYKT